MKEPLINEMFPDNYNKPWEKHYKDRTEDVTLYSHYEKYYSDRKDQYCEYCDTELGYGDDGFEDCDCEESIDEKKYRGDFPKLSQITLQSIIDMLPEGISPSDVAMDISIDAGGMGIYGHKITFSYEKTFKADPEGYAKDLKQYENNYQAYLIEKKKYDAWKKQQEVSQLEEKLNKLKGELDR